MKFWQLCMLVAAITAAPHLSRNFAFGVVAAWMLVGMWAASKGE